MISGTKVYRPLKKKMAAEIADLRGLPDPKVSGGSSVESRFLDAVYASIVGTPSGGADAYRKTEALLERLALPYDPYWDTSEAALTGGSTVTNRAYSRIRAALSATPRCFMLNVTDAPVGARWEQNHQELYRYDTTVTGRRSLNDGGPGSRIVYYATSKSRRDAKHFIARATVSYIDPGWTGPWVAQLEEYTPFPAPVPVDELELVGWNRQHAITEITYDTYRALVRAGGLPFETAGSSSAVPGLEETEVADLGLGGGRVAERVLHDFPIRDDDVPSLEIPDPLPTGVHGGGLVLVPRYIETATGLVSDDPNALPARPRDRKRDKIAEQRAVELATKALVKDGWVLHSDRQKDGVGYDLEFKRADAQLNVEIKGIVGRRLAFNITPKELWRAQTDPRWVLIAVTDVLTPRSFSLHVVTRDRVAAADRAVTGYRIRL
ncbi:protein NO VEIN domain-containing protein [Pengzhenrongella sicca]|uniref:DUF3883 domain-containing protein n=1 Tax=Pengzhenrongella sicca TaxID=2819238 RepID=A0A8A4ZGA6_9MICO|nr:DUF3883 domain-containing protein [Pengzhenrongella sicca]QTE30029.1 DUF3883 domain-containing protein [Pengzhenrongella sicca]